jgi:S1-C subfamily serine protease
MKGVGAVDYFQLGRRIAGVLLALALAGCATSSGEATNHFVAPGIDAAYIPLSGTAYLIMEGHGAAVTVSPHVAVTNAHNDNLLSGKAVIGRSANYDLLYFRTDNTAVPEFSPPSVNEKVLAYGQGVDGSLRVAQGVVKWLDAEVVARCPNCPVQHAFIFEANAGPGFSGGPVVDAESGKLVGIVFGFRDEDGGGIEKLMYAYDMNRVMAEWDNIRAHSAPSAQ